jgi:2-hydroxy-3-keto-5-methylthiopentenyl-1-phosphate phosphatase
VIPESSIRPPALLLDFDGTICPVDITARMAQALSRLGWPDELTAMRANGAGSRQVLERLIAYLPQDLPTLRAFALAHELDPAARELTEAAAAEGWPVEVVSDGLGFYVPAMLAKGGILAVIRCADVVDDDHHLRLVLPWTSRQRGAYVAAGTSKVDSVADLHARGYRVVLVGDGRSDQAAAEVADVVYATRMLAEHCAMFGIPFRPWRVLADVLSDLRGRGELQLAGCLEEPYDDEPGITEDATLPHRLGRCGRVP